MTTETGSDIVTLICKASGDPEPEISWSPIKNSTRFHDSNGVLTIKGPTPKDNVIYECYAVNKYGDDIAETKLTVGESCIESSAIGVVLTEVFTLCSLPSTQNS